MGSWCPGPAGRGGGWGVKTFSPPVPARSRGNDLLIGLCLPPQSPPPRNRFREKHPSARLQFWIVRRFGNEVGQLLDDSDLLVAVKRAGIRKNLNPHIIVVAIYIGDGFPGHFVDEGGRVLTEHRNI